MAQLTWSGDDGFDPTGRRVATIAWVFEFEPTGQAHDVGRSPALGPRAYYWEAFVSYDGRFDHVMVDGKRGTWAHKDKAKAAAESAYETWLREFPRDLMPVEVEDGDQDRKVTGVIGHARSIVRAWRAVHRPDRTKPIPD